MGKTLLDSLLYLDRIDEEWRRANGLSPPPGMSAAAWNRARREMLRQDLEGFPPEQCAESKPNTK